MLLIGDIMVSDALIEEEFVCHLESCKGACCWKGDYGAPLEPAEMELLERLLPSIRKWLTEESNAHIDAEGPYSYFEEPKLYGTTLMEDGACVFMSRDEQGIASCGIERAFNNGDIDFQKPISCHLYPVRVKKIPELAFEAVNYDQWSICSAACAHGQQLKVPLYQFVKPALVRRYGEAFYNELDAVAQDLRKDQDTDS